MICVECKYRRIRLHRTMRKSASSAVCYKLLVVALVAATLLLVLSAVHWSHLTKSSVLAHVDLKMMSASSSTWKGNGTSDMMREQHHSTAISTTTLQSNTFEALLSSTPATTMKYFSNTRKTIIEPSVKVVQPGMQ